MQVRIISFDMTFLRLSWIWLNDPQIRFLTNTPDFTEEQQMLWFESLPAKKNYLIWGLEVDSVPIGVCGLKNITKSDCEYWGYIGEKQYWGYGIGREMMSLLELEAIKSGISSIWLKVIIENTKAISLYKKLGYSIESESGNMITMRKTI